MKRIALFKEYYRFRIGLKNLKIILFWVFTVFSGLSPVYAQRAPIDIFLIIDGSSSLTAVKNEVTTWVSGRLDQILAEGDRVTVWNAGAQSKVIYSGKTEGAPGKEAVKKSIRDIAPSGNNPDFSGALRDAASRQSSGYSYTLLISASPAALSSILSTRQAGLLRFSRVEEFTNWRALVVGLNIDGKVKKSASAFFAQ
ncbi:hypothetical protein [Treponema sp. R80B11-R83G3]